MKLIDDSAKILSGREIVVAYSDGKDARVVMDLAVRYAAKVHAYYMELVPLSYINERLDAAEQRWGIPIKRVPHWSYWALRREGAFMFHGKDDEPIVSKKDLENYVRAHFNCSALAFGIRRTDDRWRASKAKLVYTNDTYLAPIFYWKTADVEGYLKSRNIPIPTEAMRDGNGVGVKASYVVWLKQNHPDDYLRLEKVFPFIGAQIERQKYGPYEF